MTNHNTDFQATRAGNVVLPNKSSLTINDTQRNHLATTASMKAYLLTQGYTADTLNKMTPNDLNYAARLKLGLV